MKTTAELLNLLPPWLVIGLLTIPAFTSLASIIFVWLSFSRFYRAKWWEEKMRVYSKLIQSLHHIKRDSEISMQAELEGRETDNNEYFKKWSERNVAAWEGIREQLDVGAFLFSSDVTRLLKELNEKSKTDIEDGYYEHLETVNVVVTEYLPLLIKAARRDLGLRAPS